MSTSARSDATTVCAVPPGPVTPGGDDEDGAVESGRQLGRRWNGLPPDTPGSAGWVVDTNHGTLVPAATPTPRCDSRSRPSIGVGARGWKILTNVAVMDLPRVRLSLTGQLRSGPLGRLGSWARLDVWVPGQVFGTGREGRFLRFCSHRWYEGEGIRDAGCRLVARDPTKVRA
jgi:hypothetical protein